MPGRTKGKTISSKTKKTHMEMTENVSQWDTITISDARRYAKLSGDYNPIHLSRWLSPLFGFKQPIAHGMYMVAKLYAKAIEENTAPPKTFNVSFCRPLLLPSATYLSRSRHSLCLLTAMKKPCVKAEL
jgi:acyl dehydratase